MKNISNLKEISYRNKMYFQNESLKYSFLKKKKFQELVFNKKKIKKVFAL